MEHIAQLVSTVFKLFILGLLIRAAISWFRVEKTHKFAAYLDTLYNPVLAPIRKVIKPVELKTTPPSQLDFAPLVLMFLVWQILYPLVMWLLT